MRPAWVSAVWRDCVTWTKYRKKRIEEELSLDVTVGEEAIHAVVLGIAEVLTDFNKYKNIIISPTYEY